MVRSTWESPYGSGATLKDGRVLKKGMYLAGNLITSVDEAFIHVINLATKKELNIPLARYDNETKISYNQP